MQCQNVVKLYAVFLEIDYSDAYLVMQRYQGNQSTLMVPIEQTFLNRPFDGHKSVIVSILRDVIEALNVIHHRTLILNGDLKPSNIQI